MPRWAWAMLAIVVLGIFAILALAAAGVYFVTQQVQVREATPAAAASLFDQSRERFRGMKPLLELDDEGRIVRSRLQDRREPSSGAAAGVQNLHVMAWDPDEEHLMQVAVPFWLLRLKRGPIDVMSDTAALRNMDLRITVDELEALGPALLIDHRAHDGDRVLVWTQ